MKASFITWYPSCRRSDALARELGGTSHLIHYLTFKRPALAPFKYIGQFVTSFKRLLSDRPDVILVASPPVVAVLSVWLFARLFRVPFVIDAHTGVFDDHRWTWLKPLSRALSRQAAATIVTNGFLRREVEAWGAQACVIGDVPVEFPSVVPLDLGPGFHVVVINTFSQDEPLDAVVGAAAECLDVQFHITGNPRQARQAIPSAPSNVRLTGWLSDVQYAALLRAADVIVTLTTHDHTMQRGAYEAMALCKPLITSDWPLLQKTFTRGTIHVNNSTERISQAVRHARREAATLANEMTLLKAERLQDFRKRLRTLRGILQIDSREVA